LLDILNAPLSVDQKKGVLPAFVCGDSTTNRQPELVAEPKTVTSAINAGR
jgi:hypothetical protein